MMTRELNAEAYPDDVVVEEKPWLLFQFPEDQKRLAKLSLDQKMEWYAHQFALDQRAATINLSTPEFNSFWKWRVLMPTKIKRFYYRVKNGEIFKHYKHISEMKAARKEKGPARI